RRHRRHPERPQFDLFDAVRKVAPREPEWKALPEGARREVMTALTRLMHDQRTPTRLQGREQTSATMRSKPARATPPAAERPRSSSIVSMSEKPSAVRRSTH